MKFFTQQKNATLLLISCALIIGLFVVHRHTTQLPIPEIQNQTSLTATVNTAEHVSIEQDQSLIPVGEILQGCFSGEDCIPSIDMPVFETVTAADEWLDPEDRVFVVQNDDITKAYPQRILNWHEIVNDWFGDTPIAVTFCPLCGTATAFERTVDGTITEFGVSGKLHNSDLIMYDRLEGNLWQQITGAAIVGPAAVEREEKLEHQVVITLEWEQVQAEYPDARVLSRQTGERRDYAAYPYGSYEQDADVGFGVVADDRLHPKSWVYGILIDGVAKAYPEDMILAELETTAAIQDNIGGQGVIIERNADSSVRFVEEATGKEIVPLRSFWFAWAAFYPDTTVFE